MAKHFSIEEHSSLISKRGMPPLHRQGVVRSEGDLPRERENPVMRMVTEEYRDAGLDLARSNIGGLCQKLALAQAPAASADGLRLTPKRKTLASGTSKAVCRMISRSGSLAGEFPRAVRAYDNAVDCMRKLMAYASKGRFYADPVSEAAVGIVESLERNPNALLCLPRLRQRDNYTYTHCVNVATLLAAFALDAEESRDTVLTYAIAGLLHDLGKALLPVSLLCAKRRLSATEYALVTRHPQLGAELIATMPGVSDDMLRAALEHHERYDGSGYPNGLSGKDISRIGLLVAIADNFDAISSRRPYKGAVPPHRTLGVMYQMRQKHFHPELLERFVRMIGIYPVGSIVELRDGYRGVVTAGNPDNPMLPVVALVMDRNGRPMPLHECDLAREPVAAIARCLSSERAGLEPALALGLPV